MAKPIFIMRFPRTWTLDHVDYVRNAIHENSKVTEDYHVLILHDMDLERPEFECYNGDGEELEEIEKITKMSIERCLKDEKRRRENEEIVE